MLINNGLYFFVDLSVIGVPSNASSGGPRNYRSRAQISFEPLASADVTAGHFVARAKEFALIATSSSLEIRSLDSARIRMSFLAQVKRPVSTENNVARSGQLHLRKRSLKVEIDT